MAISFVRRLTLVLPVCLVVSGADPVHAQRKYARRTLVLFDTAAPVFERLGGELETCAVHRLLDEKKRKGCLTPVALVVAVGHVDVRGNASESAYRARYIDTDLVYRTRFMSLLHLPDVGLKVGATKVDGLGTGLGAGVEMSTILWLFDRVAFVPSLGIKGVVALNDRARMNYIPRCGSTRA